MKFLKTISFVAVMFVMTLAGCRSNQKVNEDISVMAMETTCLGVNGDGTVVVRAWGSGDNRGNAIKQAMRNAVSDIVFKGLKKGTNYKSVELPLVTEVNAPERYADYFEPFFSPNGEYTRFVKEETKQGQRMESNGVSRKGYGVILVIDRSALRQQLKADGILK